MNDERFTTTGDAYFAGHSDGLNVGIRAGDFRLSMLTDTALIRVSYSLNSYGRATAGTIDLRFMASEIAQARADLNRWPYSYVRSHTVMHGDKPEIANA
jgi:hypothetical protein